MTDPSTRSDPQERGKRMDDDWIPCSECKAEGIVDMEWIGERYVDGTGRECPSCKGAQLVPAGDKGK